MTGGELRAAELREEFRGFDPDEVDAALGRWTALVDQGRKLDPAELATIIFRRRFRGYDRREVKALIDRLIVENT